MSEEKGKACKISAVYLPLHGKYCETDGRLRAVMYKNVQKKLMVQFNKDRLYVHSTIKST